MWAFKSAMFIPHLKIRTSLCQFFLNYSTSILFFIFMNLLSCEFHTVVFIEGNTCWKYLENNNVFVMIGFTVQSDHMIFVYIRIYSALVRSRMFSISLLITLLTLILQDSHGWGNKGIFFVTSCNVPVFTITQIWTTFTFAPLKVIFSRSILVKSISSRNKATSSWIYQKKK